MEKKKNTRPEAYPRPTETDNQMQNQEEFIDQQSNDLEETSISDIPRSNAHGQSSDSEQQTRTGE